MTQKITQWPSPAKLNLFLSITGKRDSGYHDLQTLFQFVEFGDTLEFTLEKATSTVSLSPEIPNVAMEDNLIWKAAMQLQKAARNRGIDRHLGVHIYINKVLPMGGGIGGGSSNAATTLVALNYLWDLQLSTDELAQLGLTLGADVPVFVKGIAAFAEGVGEKLTLLPPEHPWCPEEPWYLVVRPNVSISTADIFTHPELTRNTPIRTINEIMQEPYINDCEKIVRLLYTKVDKQLSWLLQYAPARLTGTGSCIFAIFKTKEEAEEVQKQLPHDIFSFVSKGTNTSPLLQTLEKYHAGSSE
ncbi:4-(cytidine 5'-diphospho)-2-C-methyl-D-erythritol kinase [Vibrio sp.]|nr:4-(cytidine 5'-diphospho)-2-C-methyl-D-erythritol kinase [Vibrio sp.]